VLTDDGFQLPTPSAERAYKSAEKLLDWSLEAEHRAAVTTFAFVEGLLSGVSDHPRW